MSFLGRFVHQGTFSDLKDKEVYRGALAEFLNLFIFCFVSGGCIIVIVGPTCSTCVGLDHGGLLCIAIVHGFTIAILVYATGNVSGGHINPAVTIALFFGGVISITRAAFYVGAQIVGAIAGSYFLKAIIPYDFQSNLGATTLSPLMNGGHGIGLEIFCTWFLMMVIFLTAVDERGAGQLAPLAIGLTVLVDHLIAVPWTGASMNPARSFGPAVASQTWDHHWIYWVGPIAGATFASLCYSIFFLRREISDKIEDEGKPQYDLHSLGVDNIRQANQPNDEMRKRRPTTFLGHEQ
eukprot:TRINITY_DN17413_c0_g1_i1.p1 TRINITY_DN17413_c0_g1~~TRINITY_DN17413_c0_g1_i1.p1  ORF type:complete len:294 (-),score=22.58 TRINITY_DN17413_c0_g1_i1:229-1110(-)